MEQVAAALLEADFLCAYGVLVDIKNHRLTDAVTFCSCTLSRSNTIRLSSILPITDVFHWLLADITDLTQLTFTSAAAEHGVEHHMQEGRRFTVYVDHKALTFATSKVSEPRSARQQRHLASVSEFTTDIQHVAGKNNHVAKPSPGRSTRAWTMAAWRRSISLMCRKC